MVEAAVWQNKTPVESYPVISQGLPHGEMSE